MNTDIINHIKALSSLDKETLTYYKSIVKTAIKQRRTIFTAGNGGSASDSAHLTGEIVGKFLIDRPGYPAVDLSANNTVITAIGNDFGYEKIFSRQLESAANQGDVFIGFTTSGNSKNILEGAKQAKKMGLEVLIISGRDGGEIAKEGFKSLIVNSNSTPVIQIVHGFILHQIAYVTDEVFREQDDI